MVHPTTLAISVKESILHRDTDGDIEHVECVLCVHARLSITQQAMILGETGLCGATYLIKTEELCFSLNPFVHNVVKWTNVLEKSCRVQTNQSDHT